MSDNIKELSKDDHSMVCTYLGFARDAAVRADWARRNQAYVDFSMLDMVANLKTVADILGLELIERHPVKTGEKYSDPIPPHPGIDVVASR